MRLLYLTALCAALFVAMPSAARAQAPIFGQPYQVPFEYSGYGAGTLINYGGFNYVVQGDATMLLSGSAFYPAQQVYYPQHWYPVNHWHTGGHRHFRRW